MYVSYCVFRHLEYTYNHSIHTTCSMYSIHYKTNTQHAACAVKVGNVPAILEVLSRSRSRSLSRSHSPLVKRTHSSKRTHTSFPLPLPLSLPLPLPLALPLLSLSPYTLSQGPGNQKRGHGGTWQSLSACSRPLPMHKRARVCVCV